MNLENVDDLIAAAAAAASVASDWIFPIELNKSKFRRVLRQQWPPYFMSSQLKYQKSNHRKIAAPAASAASPTSSEIDQFAYFNMSGTTVFPPIYIFSEFIHRYGSALVTLNDTVMTPKWHPIFLFLSWILFWSIVLEMTL